MKRWLKISFIILACLMAFQMWFRYRINSHFSSDSLLVEYSVIDRLTGKHYLLFVGTDTKTGANANFSLFPYPRQNFNTTK